MSISPDYNPQRCTATVQTTKKRNNIFVMCVKLIRSTDKFIQNSSATKEKKYYLK